MRQESSKRRGKVVIGKTQNIYFDIDICNKIFISVFTDGALIENESIFPKDTEVVRKHGKLFFFHLIEPDELTEGNKPQ